jgi:hypothetical protein
MKIKTVQELEKVRAKAKSMVTRRAGVGAIASGIPFLGGIVGAGADVINLTTLLPAINKEFGLDPEQIDALNEQQKQVVAVIVERIGSLVIGKVVTKQLVMMVLKRVGVQVTAKAAAGAVPLIGQGVAVSLSFGTLKYLGNSHVDDCYAVVKELIESGAKT